MIHHKQLKARAEAPVRRFSTDAHGDEPLVSRWRNNQPTRVFASTEPEDGQEPGLSPEIPLVIEMGLASSHKGCDQYDPTADANVDRFIQLSRERAALDVNCVFRSR
jgi:hypothetical protein